MLISTVNPPYIFPELLCAYRKALRADLYLSGITQLITVLLADKLHKHEYIRSVKSLAA